MTKVLGTAARKKFFRNKKTPNLPGCFSGTNHCAVQRCVASLSDGATSVCAHPAPEKRASVTIKKLRNRLEFRQKKAVLNYCNAVLEMWLALA